MAAFNLTAQGEAELSGPEAELWSCEVSRCLTAEGETHDQFKTVAQGENGGWTQSE